MMRLFIKLGFISLLPALLGAAGYAHDGAGLELEHPELEQTHIMPPDEAQKELKGIQDRVRNGDLPKIQFDFDSDKLRPESIPTLDAIADLLLRHPDRKLRVEAHTCRLGSEEYNLKLSTRRAKAVRDHLIQKGVPPPSIRFHGHGYSEPIADNGTPEGRARNRRVEFRLFTRDWSSVY